MKRTLLTFITALMAFPLFAQYTGPGYYRIKNQGEAGRYISIQNNKVSQESKSISFSSGKAVNAAVEALQTVHKKDGDPGTILYISGNENGLIIKAQGMDTQQLLTEFGYGSQQLKVSSKGELNTTYSGYQIDLIDYCFDYPINKTGFCGVATLNYISQMKTADLDARPYALWEIKKIDNETEFFGVDPKEGIQVGDKYYTTLYTAFAYQLSDGMKAYYIDKHYYDTNHVQEPIAELKEITDGKIPAKTPVIIECSSNNVANNKVTLIEEALNPISGNELEGRVFCYVPNKSEDQGMKNALEYNKNTMRLLGTVNGKLAFVENNSAALSKDCIPANKAYLPISSSFAAKTANGIKLLLPNDYDTAMSINKVTSDDTTTKEGIYTLTGVKVRDTNSTEDLPRGIYIIGGKKQVIQ